MDDDRPDALPTGLLFYDLVPTGLGRPPALSAFPFSLAVIMSTHTSTEIFSYPPKLLPGSHFLENVRSLLDDIDFFGSMLNSLLVATTVTFLVLFFDSLAAFVFAKFKFPGRRLLFGLMMIFMVPAQLAAIPQSVIMAKPDWVGSMTSLIVPTAANAFGIFWMRQYMKGAIHDELLDVRDRSPDRVNLAVPAPTARSRTSRAAADGGRTPVSTRTP